jgi:hypothetical protein
MEVRGDDFPGLSSFLPSFLPFFFLSFSFFLSLSFFSLFLTVSCYVAQGGLKLNVLLPQPPQCWGLKACITVPGSSSFSRYFLSPLSLSLSLLLPVTYSFLLSCAPNFALKAQPCHLRLKEVVNNKSSGGQQKKASLETKPEIKY